MKPLTIGQVARESGVGVETNRFYEREGLVGAPPRWTEYEAGDPELTPGARGLGSPTILVDGRDVAGACPACWPAYAPAAAATSTPRGANEKEVTS
jgi:hypothetical protein